MRRHHTANWRRAVHTIALLSLGHLAIWPLGHPLVSAEVPHLIRYQGQAVDSKGVPLEGPYTLTFRLYDAETVGVKLWEETQAGVQLAGGHFSVLLGQVTSLVAVDWSTPCWLSVQVNAEPELTPRQRITSVPLALRAGLAEKAHEADQLTVPVTTSTITDDANRLVPSSAIILWDGASCPAGYSRVAALDGALVKFGSAYAAPAASGASELPAHSHAGSVDSQGAHQHTLRWRSDGAGGNGTAYMWAGGIGTSNSNDRTAPSSIDTAGAHIHTLTINPAGSGKAATLLACKKD